MEILLKKGENKEMKIYPYSLFSVLVAGVILSGCGQNDLEKQIQPQQSTQQMTQQVAPSSSSASNNTQKPSAKTKTTEQLLKEKIKEEKLLKAKIEEQAKQIQELTDEVEYYRTFVKEFTTTFTADKMQEFIDKEWTYQLSINNIHFPKNGVLELSEPSFDLVLKEDRVKYSVIPDEMSQKGRLTNGITGKLTIKTNIPYKTKEDLGDKHSVITYSFKDVPKNTVIKLTISDDLMKELKMETNELEIRIQ